MKKFAISCLLSMFAVSAFAAPPQVPDTIPAQPNEIVMVDVKIEAGKELGFHTAFSSKDCIFVRLYSEDPTSFVFLAQPKKAGQFVVVFWTVGEKKGASTTIGGGDSPTPPTPPVPPNPDPEPVHPDGRFKLAKTSYDLSMKLVPANGREKAAKALAGSFRSIRAAIAAGTIKDIEEILVKTTESNRAALANAGANKTAWEPMFKALQDIIYVLYEQGKLESKSDFADAWSEIENGLNVVK